jgi:tetratricopeptide (TPR) repeat protein
MFLAMDPFQIQPMKMFYPGFSVFVGGNRWLGWLLFFLWVGSIDPGVGGVVGLYGQSVRDRVVVMTTSPTKILNNEVGKVYEGEIHTISAINGQWCALEDIEGWLPLRNVNYLKNGLEHFSGRIQKNKNDFAAFAHRGMIHYENQAYDKAFYDLNESLKLNQKNAVTWNNRGKVLLAQRKPNLALEDVKYAITLNPNFPLAYFNLGRIYHALQEWEQAVAAYDQAIRLNSSLSDFYLNRGNALMMLGENGRAEEDFNQSIKINSKKADAFVGLSNLYLGKDQPEEAFRYADKAVGLAPKDPFSLNARGWALYKLNRTQEAILDLNQAIAEAPRFSLAFNNRGVCYSESGDDRKAILDYTEALRLNPNDGIARTNRGNAWFRIKDYKSAQEDFEKSLEQNPDLIEGINSYAWFLATCPEPRFRNPELALEQAGKIAELSDKEDWNHLKTLAVVLAENGRFEEASVKLRKAIQIAPEKEQSSLNETMELFQAGKKFSGLSSEGS